MEERSAGDLSVAGGVGGPLVGACAFAMEAANPDSTPMERPSNRRSRLVSGLDVHYESSCTSTGLHVLASMAEPGLSVQDGHAPEA